jgi:hypothetical protein
VAESVKAQTPLPYATSIPTRTPRFKPHRNIGQVKNAVTHYLRFTRDRGATLYHRADDGVFNQHMTVYRFDVGSGEYVPWVEIRRGERRSAHPELMPDHPNPVPMPDDPPEHTVQATYHHTLTCGYQTCLESASWHSMTDRNISPVAMNSLTGSGWGVRDGKWMCREHKREGTR